MQAGEVLLGHCIGSTYAPVGVARKDESLQVAFSFDLFLRQVRDPDCLSRHEINCGIS